MSVSIDQTTFVALGPFSRRKAPVPSPSSKCMAVSRNSLGTDLEMVSVPLPTLRCWLCHAYLAPSPAGGPKYWSFMLGSILCHGDHFSQFVRTLICSKTFSGG